MDVDAVAFYREMKKFCFIMVANCDGGLLPKAVVYSHFPYLNTVYHGEGATSYQNVHFQNHGSVPIPKNLQVDDGHLYNFHAHGELITPGLHSSPHSHELLNHVIVASEAPYINVHDHLELPPHYEPLEHYELYDHGVEHEFH
ncbi:hypothetical protein PV326_005269 [Microctonus aethiopoides]|nr:hypothetical protein PV326_005269 [Microctonus aethiopoides]